MSKQLFAIVTLTNGTTTWQEEFRVTSKSTAKEEITESISSVCSPSLQLVAISDWEHRETIDSDHSFNEEDDDLF